MPENLNQTKSCSGLPTSPIPERKSQNLKTAVFIGGVAGFLILGVFILPNLINRKGEISSTQFPVNSITSGSPNDTEFQLDKPEEITQQEAVALVNRWLEAKKIMNSPPYNRSVVSEITAGTQYENAIGTISWLQENNAQYEYHFQEIQSIDSFYSDNSRAEIQLTISEDLSLYVAGRKDLANSGIKKTVVVYSLQFVNDGWKITSSRVIS